MVYDIVIRGGTVIDGTGAPGRRADVGIVGDRVVEIGDCVGEATRTFDATGRLVTPGFIDIHTQRNWLRVCRALRLRNPSRPALHRCADPDRPGASGPRRACG